MSQLSTTPQSTNLKNHKVWIASYPRSGNTLTRIILNRCCGVVVSSVYDEGPSGDPRFADLIGRRVTKPAVEFVKTHEYPLDDSPAIYIVRDGRASIVSYHHFLINEGGQSSIEQLIVGGDGFGSWSDHYRAWSPEARPNTLLLHFEDLIEKPDDAVSQISARFALPVLSKFDLSFADLHHRVPEFFRSGSNSRNIAELSMKQRSLFDHHHGSLMEELAYNEPSGA